MGQMVPTSKAKGEERKIKKEKKRRRDVMKGRREIVQLTDM